MNLEQKNGVPTTQETRALVRNSDKHRAGGGLLRFIRFEMDHRRNTTRGVFVRHLQKMTSTTRKEN
jgi:hypothetical protein